MPGRLTQSANIHGLAPCVDTAPQAPGSLLCTEETDAIAQWAGGHTGDPAWPWGLAQTSWRSEWDESGNSPQGRDDVWAKGTVRARAQKTLLQGSSRKDFRRTGQCEAWAGQLSVDRKGSGAGVLAQGSPDLNPDRMGEEPVRPLAGNWRGFQRGPWMSSYQGNGRGRAGQHESALQTAGHTFLKPGLWAVQWGLG